MQVRIVTGSSTVTSCDQSRTGVENVIEMTEDEERWVLEVMAEFERVQEFLMYKLILKLERPVA